MHSTAFHLDVIELRFLRFSERFVLNFDYHAKYGACFGGRAYFKRNLRTFRSFTFLVFHAVLLHAMSVNVLLSRRGV